MSHPLVLVPDERTVLYGTTELPNVSFIHRLAHARTHASITFVPKIQVAVQKSVRHTTERH